MCLTILWHWRLKSYANGATFEDFIWGDIRSTCFHEIVIVLFYATKRELNVCVPFIIDLAPRSLQHANDDDALFNQYIQDALGGFIFVLTEDGQCLYISSNVTENLGLQQVLAMNCPRPVESRYSYIEATYNPLTPVIQYIVKQIFNFQLKVCLSTYNPSVETRRWRDNDIVPVRCFLPSK